MRKGEGRASTYTHSWPCPWPRRPPPSSPRQTTAKQRARVSRTRSQKPVTHSRARQASQAALTRSQT